MPVKKSVKTTESKTKSASNKKPKKAIFFSKDQLNYIETLASMGIWEMDANGVDIFWSDEFYRMHGLKPQSVKPSAELRLSMVHPDDREGLIHAFGQSYHTHKPYSLQKRIVLPDGKIKWVLSKGNVEVDSKTGLSSMLGVMIDITAQKLIELEKAELEKRLNSSENEALQRSLSEFQYAISNSSIVSRADKSGAITYVNANFIKISGYSEQELLGQNHRIINSKYHPKSFWITMWKTIAQGQVWRGEVKNKAKDGTFYWVDTFVMPFIDDKGNVREFLSIRNDISKRKIQEENIIQLNQSLSDFQDAIQYSSIVSRADRAGYISYVNENFVKISGYSSDELIGQNHRIVNSGYHPKSFWVEMWKTIANGKIWRAEVKNKAKDGSYYWVDTFVMPFVDEDGGVREFLSIRNDITSRKQFEEELDISRQRAEKANQAKSEFLANMSHEIRTPLNGVVGFTDLLMNTKLDAIQSQYMALVNQSANNLLDIVNNILDFSKIEAGKMELYLSSTDLLELCKEVTELAGLQAQQKKIKLVYHYYPTLPQFVIADSVRLKQVLLNLLSNAIKFTESGEVELKVEPSDIFSDVSTNNCAFRFSVRDTGVGIRKDNFQKIFNSFSQEDSSITRRYGGTGLGLPISNNLLQLMGSQLELKSQYGVGSVFYFDIVFAVSPAEQHWIKPELIKSITEDHQLPIENQQKINDDHFKILVVEDNSVNMYLTKAILGNASPNVVIVEASNGYQAVDMFNKEKPDIVLMDVQMPEMNGYEATALIRKIEQHNQLKRTPIIALTAGAVQGEKEKCLEAGMDDFITKPIVNKVIEKTLATWLTNK